MSKVSYLRYLCDFQLKLLLYVGSPQLLLPPQSGNKGTSSRQGPSLGVFSRLPSLQPVHHILEVSIIVS